VIGLAGIAADITERKKSVEALLESEKRFREFADMLPQTVFEIDQQGQLTFTNRGAWSMFGYPRDEVLEGRNILEAIVPSDHEKALEKMKSVMMGNPSQGGEYTMARKDGSTFPAIIYAAPFTKGGVAIGLRGIILDITERKRVEEAVHHERNLLRTLIDNLPESVLIYVKDCESRYVINNLAHLRSLGVTSQEDVLGKTSFDFFPPEQAEKFFAGEREVIRAGKTLVDVEEEVYDKTRGTTRWHSSTEVPLRDTTGKVVGLVGMSTEITERKRADLEIRRLNEELEGRVRERTAQLEAANKELESFSYSVSHDLRAPLRHISGYIEILRDRTASLLDEESKRYLTTASEAAVRLGSLIDDLLTFSRIGRTELRKGNIDVRQLVNEVKQELEAEIRGRTIEWEIKSLPDVQADRLMLKLVLTNLMSNAVKFTRQRDHARIEIGSAPSSSSGENVYYVKDNGAGFDMKYSAKLFGVFQRLHTAEEFEGTGIGLANVKRIALLHGGTTWAEAAVDKGATFFLSLPGKD
jgi:PAS domain S-box-containing protein